MEDRVFFNALYFADGNEAIATDIANEIIHQRYQPATPSFLNAGRARRGELVSCFLIQVTDDMNSIGRSINSALQLSRIGGGVGISLSNLREAGAPIKGCLLYTSFSWFFFKFDNPIIGICIHDSKTACFLQRYI